MKKLKSIPVYLPEEKREAVNQIAIDKRMSKTKLIELEVDKLIKRENKK